MTQPPHSYLPRQHKEPPAHAPNAALLIDFDNVTMAIRSDLQTELKRLLQSDIIRGKVAVQRAYADWRRYQQYVVPLAESSIDLIFAPAYGSNKKNATDIRLAIDALELVFTRPEIGTFILLSGDSDFSALVLKLKEYGKYVIGVGIRESSSDLLIQNCDEYYSYNELAGFTKESDITHERHDPWELVVEALKQMTAHNDVMRSDRLKQVMQEIDPNFDEKDAGFSRFSKFVVEAAHRGLITLTKLDNGQYEIALGAGVPGAAAQPSIGGSVDRSRDRERGGRGGGRRAAEAPAPAAEQRRSGFSLDGAFGLIKQAIGKLGGDSRPVSAEEIGEAMAEIKGDDEPVEPGQVQKLLRQAHDRELIDLAKDDNGEYTVKLREATPVSKPAPVGVTDADEANDPPMPESSAPPSMRQQPQAPPAGGIPSRSARFRRGSRGPRVGPPEVPKIGVVEIDPNFKPRIELLPPKPTATPPAPVGSEPPSIGAPVEREQRGGGGASGGGGRGRGGRGRRGGGREERESTLGERGEQSGRGRRGGRGRGGRGRGGSRSGSGAGGGVSNGERGEPRDTFEPRMAPSEPRSPAAPAAPAPSAPTKPPARDSESNGEGESFWSKVKRGLTGGA
ncbi:MAG TPA: NYN domain-containing protein [Gemmatimonadales bacterium]|nr:NYN domain-containing protein [Gemmatimonadales bacterium]